MAGLGSFVDPLPRQNQSETCFLESNLYEHCRMDFLFHHRLSFDCERECATLCLGRNRHHFADGCP